MRIFDQQQAQSVIENIESLDWDSITTNMHNQGYALIENFLSDALCSVVKANYSNERLYRKTVNMQRFRFGLGEYKYFTYPLPNLIQLMRAQFYPYLVPIANTWFRVLNIDTQFPNSHAELLAQCQQSGQEKATVLILQYQQKGFNTLHQDIYGEVYFPIQMVIFLNQVNVDFTGGEFILTQQIPRAQSKAIVLQPNKGDVLIFTTQFKPEAGARGYYRVNMKHGVSEVHSGERYSLGIIFHDAVS